MIPATNTSPNSKQHDTVFASSKHEQNTVKAEATISAKESSRRLRLTGKSSHTQSSAGASDKTHNASGSEQSATVPNTAHPAQ